MDFGSLGEVVHVGDASIVPGSRYEVRAVDCIDGDINRDVCSESLTVSTSKYGDTILSCAGCPCEPPEGIVNVIDCKAIADRFVSASCAPIKARVDIEPGIPDRVINVTDLVACFFTGFPGVDYSLSEPQRCAP